MPPPKMSALVWAITEDRAAVVDLMIRRGANLNPPEEFVFVVRPVSVLRLVNGGREKVGAW